MARVIQITDMHLSTDPADKLLDCRTLEGLHAVLRAIQDSYPQCDRLIVTGDLVHEEGPEAYYVMRELLTPWDNKLRVIPGNHDLRDGLRTVFGDRMNGCDHADTFTDELSGWHLIGLDTRLDGSVQGDMSGLQWEWLESELEASSLPTAIFMHHPPVFVGSEWLDQLGLVSFVKFANLVERFEQIKLVVCGHVHQEFQTQLFQAQVFTTPSTSVQFKVGSRKFATEDLPPGFLVIDLHEDAQFETTLVRVS